MIPMEIKEMFSDLFAAHKKKILVIGAALAVGLGSIAILGKDNAIEQKAEKVIEQQTGISIDLSP